MSLVITAGTLISPGSRGAVLVDPAFIHLSSKLKLKPSAFDPKTDSGYVFSACSLKCTNVQTY